GEQPQFQQLGFACCQHGYSGIAFVAIRQIAIQQAKRRAGKEKFPLVPPASFPKGKAGSESGIQASRALPESTMRGLPAGNIAQRQGCMRVFGSRKQRVPAGAIWERFCLRHAILV
ncbi:MAG TPA: hypothetical protein VE957_10040, partial [Terriglobales bacterium]|nr:hypothetical protein [Terriglobales bacterium]